METPPVATPARPLDQPGGSEARVPLRVAAVDGDRGFLQVVAARLRARGGELHVRAAATPVEELVRLRLSALVLDLAALGPAGWAYLERVCREAPALPVVVCSGPSTVAERVRALRLGADDWLAKPCHPEELLARIEAIVRRGRRAAGPARPPALEVGEVTIRPDQFQAFVGARSLDLTRREFELIRLLAAHAGRVLEREEIYRRVWGYEMAHGDRSVDVFVRKLRRKLERGSPGWRYIHTHFGVGYRFAPERITDPDGADAPAAPVAAAAPADPAAHR